jgi:predicted Rossmann fold flavoprotein
MNVAIIGGGAAGFFAAIAVKENFPTASVTIFEKSTKILTKVKISGGGRCNVTNAATNIKKLATAYPRGANKLKKAFAVFSNKDTIAWFEARGVPLYTQDDDRVFPVSQESQSIIDCFVKETKKKNIRVSMSSTVLALNPLATGQIELAFKGNSTKTFDKVIVASGGSPKATGLSWLAELNHTINLPVPSLFTFNMPKEAITKLMGVVINPVQVTIQGTKLHSSGPLLITHWGMSGPAILKLSAFGAILLNERKYQFTIQVNWVNQKNAELVQKELEQIITNHSKKLVLNFRPYGLQNRFWEYVIDRLGFSKQLKWHELGKKRLNQLVNILTNDSYQVSGKTTFKEEFVTCGGVSLDDVDFKTMQSKSVQNLYFAGEVLDVDGITGGYNFQSAWTTGFIAGKLG